MDLKISGLLFMIVFAITLINGQDDLNVEQQKLKNRKQLNWGWPRHLLTPIISKIDQPGSQQQLKYMSASKQSESPYSSSFLVEWSFGIVPYYVDEEVYDENLKMRIQKAMEIVEASSCVIFKEQISKPQGSNVSWLHFTNPNRKRECSHDTYKGEDGDIIIVLGIECLKTRDLLHSVLHGLGFKDEVSHPHRDQYIRILWENVQPKYRPLFRVRPDKAPHKLVEYDPMSIMHFHDRAYSENGGLTIAPVMPGLAINPSDKLSQLDVMKLRLTFGHECNKRKVGNLIENCKNVLHNENPNSGYQTLNAEEEDEDQQLNADEDNYDLLLNTEEKEDDQQLNADEDNDNQLLNTEEKEDDQQLNADEKGDDDQLLNSKEKEEDDQQLNTDEKDDDDQQLNAEGKDDDDQQLNAEGKNDADQQLNAEENKDQLKDVDENDDKIKAEDGSNHQRLADPKIGYLPKAEVEEIHNPMDLRSPKDEIVEGVREGRRDFPLHLWKYNTEKLH